MLDDGATVYLMSHEYTAYQAYEVVRQSRSSFPEFIFNSDGTVRRRPRPALPPLPFDMWRGGRRIVRTGIPRVEETASG